MISWEWRGRRIKDENEMASKALGVL